MNQIQIETLKHLGFEALAKSSMNWMLQKDGHDVATFLFSEDACWSRAAALANLHTEFPSWMMKKKMMEEKVTNIDTYYDLLNHNYSVMIYKIHKNIYFSGFSHNLVDALCEAFNKLMTGDSDDV